MNIPGSFNRGESTTGAEKEGLFAALLVVLGAMAAAGMLGRSIRLTLEPPPPFGEGATGKHVGIWQAVVGAKMDRVFGPKTRAATEIWSEKAGFGRRAQVNEAMWTVGVGTTIAFIDGFAVLPSGERVELAPLAEHAAEMLGKGD
jgi:hypothetical protein